MNIFNSSGRTTTNCEQSTQPSQTTRVLSDSFHSRMPGIPPYSVKPMVSQNIKTRPPYVYPKHTETSFGPSFSANPKTTKIDMDQNVLSPDKSEETTTKEVPAKETSSTINSPKANPAILTSSNQWWMEYDEILGKYLK